MVKPERSGLFPVGVPKYPIWEIAILLMSLIFGIDGIVSPNTAAVESTFSGWSLAWNISYLVGGSAGLVGLFLRIPNGVILMLVAKVILGTSSAAALAGFAILFGDPLFSGSYFLWILTIGSVVRAYQLAGHMRQMKMFADRLEKRDQ